VNESNLVLAFNNNNNDDNNNSNNNNSFEYTIYIPLKADWINECRKEFDLNPIDIHLTIAFSYKDIFHTIEGDVVSKNVSNLIQCKSNNSTNNNTNNKELLFSPFPYGYFRYD
jgi:hypothetical protein